MVLRQLEYLDALAREGHFGRAAAACHVSQPALSTALQRLEVELGVTLIRRGRRFEGLTTEGEALLQWARSALASVEGLAAEASSLRGALAGKLRLAAIPTVAARTGEVLGTFMHRHPGVRIELSTGVAAKILDGIARHELDGGLVYVDDEPLPEGMQSLALYRDRLVLLTSDAARATTGDQTAKRLTPDITTKSHAHDTITWAEAADLPLCLLEPAMQNRQLIDRAFAAASRAAQPQVEADSVAALVELGLAGGSCIVADTWIRDRPLPAGARVLALQPEVAPTVGLVTQAGPLAPPAARTLRDALAAQRLPD